jgi:hypothetical protein
VWLARPENAVDILVGNPPWLSYRFMTESMQATFRQMTTERGMWAGASVATHQDLSALFVARTAELYLRPGGRFGYVMPLAALSRRQFAGFRTGSFPSPHTTTAVAFDTPWDLHAVKPSFFPVPASVVFGTRADSSVPLHAEAVRFAGRLPSPNSTWADAAAQLTVDASTSGRVDSGAAVSPYAPRFAQGATVVPRMLFCVVDGPVSPLGSGAGRRSVTSRRSSNEKKPWKGLAALSGNVERRFVTGMHLGETILPFRLQEPWSAVIPWDGDRLLGPDDEHLDEHPGLAAWWRAANDQWVANRSSGRLTLLERVDYMRGLSQQLPGAPHRVVYTKGGMYLAAARVEDPEVIIDHKLYWAAVSGVDEGRYLTAVLNSDAITSAVRPLQARGEHNPRDFDKYVFQLPIPTFDAGVELHRNLVDAAAHAEAVVGDLELPDVSFQAQRRLVRRALSADGVAAHLDSLVASLLGSGPSG